jgi:hypothetical protein
MNQRLEGLLNYTYEPKKPVSLGTMFRNGVKCITGVLVVQDVVQLSEQQSQKDFLGLRSSMPDGSEITAHAAEVLHLVSKSGLPDLRGWVGGDS